WVNVRVRESNPAMLGPLWLLQWRQDRARLPSTVSPPCCRAMMWSISNGRGKSSCGMWQNSQAFPARRQTTRTSVSSMNVSGCLGLAGLLQRLPGLGMEDSEQAADIHVVRQFPSLLGGEGAVLVAQGQVVHTSLVLLAEPEREDVAGQFRRQAFPAPAQSAPEDGRLARLLAGVSFSHPRSPSRASMG